MGHGRRAADMLLLDVFPNAKEITESAAAVHATKTVLNVHPGDPDVAVWCVGDGRTPRTAVLAAFTTNWRCISIDPMQQDRTGRCSHVRRLQQVPKCTLDVQPADITLGKTATTHVILAVHSHAPLDASIRHLMSMVDHPERVHVVAIPCCVHQNLTGCTPNVIYADNGIHSPHDKVMVWWDFDARRAV